MFRITGNRLAISLIALLGAGACRTIQPIHHMSYKEHQLTTDAKGHTINNIQAFSSNDQWLVYDTRNNDSGIGHTGSIEMVNTATGETKPLYHTQHQTSFGPGVGAATFSPTGQRVLFIHGIRNADESRPYDMTRRTGVAIDTANPFVPVFIDARDVKPPFTAGALRGGTHAHSWSGDGKWISCTYNDYVLQQLAKTDHTVRDLRTIAVMAPVGRPVTVQPNGLENNNGELFSVVAVTVVPDPKPGTDEIDRAFDETWIGTRGYRRADQRWQERAIAFQGNVREENGQSKTEIFVVDLPADISQPAAGQLLQGTERTMPAAPAGAAQRRITHTREGVHGPRHWLRSTSDGTQIAFLAKDDRGVIQIFGVSPNGGPVQQLTFNDFSVQAPFNYSPDNNEIAYIADNSIFITDLRTHIATRLTPRTGDEEAPQSGVVWSHSGNMLAYNRYATTTEGRFLQIFLLRK